MSKQSTSVGRRPTSQPGLARLAIAVLAGLLVLAACNGTGKGKTEIEVSTPEGQVSLSLTGKLPPNWPPDVPVPPGADPAGSASLVGKSNGIKAGVYRSRQSPERVYEYYTTEPSITTTSKAAVGSGSNYVGRVSITAPVAANITIVPYQHGSLIVIVIPGGHGPSTTPTTIPEGSSGRR
jgi:hypothetical protein